MILIWSLVLGGVGFLCGFIGPLVIAPEANQGPLLGILITGPGGLVAGAVLAAVVGLFGWPAATNVRILSVAAVIVAAGALYLSIPRNQHIADLVDGEISSCVKANAMRDSTIARLTEIESTRLDRKATAWGEKVDRAFADNPGIVINVRVLRVRTVSEGRARWNYGLLSAEPWFSAARSVGYFVAGYGESCDSYPIGSRLKLAVRGSIGVWPPYGLAEMLGMQVAERLPEKYSALTVE